MLVLRVQINEETPVTAGAEDLGVLNAIVGAGGRLGRNSSLGRARELPHVYLTLGGLTAREDGLPNEHRWWMSRRELTLGDRIVIEVLEALLADPIESGSVAEKRAQDEKEYFEHSKKVYLQLRSKYDAEA